MTNYNQTRFLLLAVGWIMIHGGRSMNLAPTNDVPQNDQQRFASFSHLKSFLVSLTEDQRRLGFKVDLSDGSALKLVGVYDSPFTADDVHGELEFVATDVGQSTSPSTVDNTGVPPVMVIHGMGLRNPKTPHQTLGYEFVARATGEGLDQSMDLSSRAGDPHFRVVIKVKQLVSPTPSIAATGQPQGHSVAATGVLDPKGGDSAPPAKVDKGPTKPGR